MNENLHGKNVNKQIAFFVLGLAIIGLFFLLPIPQGLQPAGMYTFGIMITIVFWWLTETLPIPVTGLMVPVLLHLTGVLKIDKAIASSFGDSLVAFLIGVLALSVAFSKSGLGKRLTYLLLSLSGTRSVG
jgi:sodium-dependent dicarboxylate transporter 2/3/5